MDIIVAGWWFWCYEIGWCPGCSDWFSICW